MVESATQAMVADEFYDCKPYVDLSEEVLMQVLKSLLALICSRRVTRIFAAR